MSKTIIVQVIYDDETEKPKSIWFDNEPMVDLTINSGWQYFCDCLKKDVFS